MSIFGRILSFALDISPLGNIKSALEGLSGYDTVTFEKLDFADRAMCLVGLIPFGNIAKKLLKSAKAVKRFTPVINGASKASELMDIKSDIDEAKDIYGNLKEHIKKEGGLVRLAEKNISDAFDFVRYDDGTTASSLRVFGTVSCAIVSPIVNLPKNMAKQVYYGVNSLLGKSDEEIEKSLEDMKQGYEKAKDKLIDKMIDTGLNVRFINDIVSPFKTVFDYYNIASLSPEELERYLAFDREKAYRYKNIEKKELEQNKNKEPLEFTDPARAQQLNNKKLKDKLALDKAKDNLLKESAKKRKNENKNNSKNNQGSKGWLSPYGFIFPLFGFLGSLFRNTFGILGDIFGNFWNKKFGDGNYGFHVCPYGCGRPIPNSFYGCSELLQAYPNYFN
jgi:hypothetical protein